MTELATRSARRRAGGLPRWLAAALLLAALLGGGDRSAAEDSAAPTWVENPEYLAWSTFQPGAWATHEARWTDTDRVSGKVSTGVRTWTERLEQVLDERLVLTLTMTTVHSWGTKVPVVSPPIRREVLRWRGESEPDPRCTTTHRAETLTIRGKRLECERTDEDCDWKPGPPRPGASPRDDIRPSGTHWAVWRSAAVPGGLIRAEAKDARLLGDGTPETSFSVQTSLTDWGSK